RTVWQVCAGRDRFDLVDTSDFFRLVVLLEHSYTDVETAIDCFAKDQRAEVPFPMQKIIAAALASKSQAWTSRALAWVTFLSRTEITTLKDVLKDVQQAKWASQNNRQLASKYLKRI